MKKSTLFGFDTQYWSRAILSPILNFIFVFIKLFRNTSKTANGTLIISLSHIGDTVFTIPSVRLLQNRNPEVTILCYNHSKIIYNLFFENINFITVRLTDTEFGGRILSSKYRRILKKLNPQNIFDLTGSILSASAIFNSKAENIIGFNKVHFRTLYTSFTPIRKTPHLIDMYLDVPRLIYRINENELIREFPISFNKEEKILLHPFAGWEAKQWGLKKFIELTALIKKNYNICWIFSKENSSDELIEHLNKNNIEYIISASFVELLEQLKLCSCIISNDSGPLYVANALGKPTFTIYGPTNPEYSLPFGEHHGFIQNIIECSPKKGEQYCFTDAGRNCKNFECMNLLSVEKVFISLASFLDSVGIKKI